MSIASKRIGGPVMCVVGARPNFMKMAPILRALASHEPPLPALLVHTGQHYDQDMSERLFEDLVGGANDVAFYKADIDMPRLLPVAKLLGFSPNYQMSVATAVRNGG